jgi:acyl dehydratase
MIEGAQRIIAYDRLSGLVGERVGLSRWEAVDQDQVNLFAEATGDHQWIHVDPERAAAGPFGATIAHGYLVLSLAPMLLWDVLEVTGVSQVINYGMEKVRFPTPVPVGSRVRMAVDLVALKDVVGGLHATLGLTFELEGGAKPACVAEILFRYYV